MNPISVGDRELYAALTCGGRPDPLVSLSLPWVLRGGLARISHSAGK
jgi:hypothetical protein